MTPRAFSGRLPVVLSLVIAFSIGVLVRAADDPHGEIGIDCATCHDQEGWSPLRKPLPFKHKQVARPLTGSHKQVACRSCHADLRFGHVATSCSDCHADIHRGEFGFRCETCHLPQSWDNRRRMWDRHSETLFPLTGAHTAVDCGACHSGTEPFQYALTRIDCIDCHADDYQSTNDPDHQAVGFPTTCEVCHGTSSWDARGFPDHESIFPINSGPHGGAWSRCQDCHTTPGDLQTVDCLNCHEHSRSRMDDKHSEISGYVYESSACLSCHPTGRE